ncbi:hypothetical protein X777_03140 [Ooceraea biroi]|uniref:Uncharacterized protein n=1 Tax=Ooceraea biroi TaxID=2015173 RepID=A0A026WMS4_OOCBI|nr:hypothetical protein X777_03140 [Ooceraea biroi]
MDTIITLSRTISVEPSLLEIEYKKRQSIQENIRKGRRTERCDSARTLLSPTGAF